jgi:hypothetical protein
MLTAEPLYPNSTFPRRNWAVLCNEVPIGEMMLTGWGSGFVVLREQHYSTTATPEVSAFGPESIPREYKMFSSVGLLHSLVEEQRDIYCINSPADSDNGLLKLEGGRPAYIFGGSFPSYRLYRESDPSPIGRILKKKAFHDGVVANLPPEIGETLQIFLLWLVVDKAQWTGHLDRS